MNRNSSTGKVPPVQDWVLFNTLTYAKKVKKLQERLNVIWIIRNFVRVHYTTKEVQAVMLGVIEEGRTLGNVVRVKGVKS